MNQAVQPGSNQPGARSDATPASDEFDHASPPVNDDNGDLAPENQPDDRPPENPDEPAPRRDAPKKPPSDLTRDAIAERFSKTRGDEPATPADEDGDKGDEDGDKDAPAKGGDEPDDGNKGDKGGKGDDETPSDRLTLKVFGKEQAKTIDEIAVLADMTPEEVREKPDRAIKFAQRELATIQRLEEAKRIHREADNRTAGDEPAPRADHRAPDPEHKDAGRTEDPDRPKQPGDDKKPAVDFKQLVEALQIEDPDVAGEKLREAFDTFAQANQSAVKESVSEVETERLIDSDKRESAGAVKKFTDAHPEIAQNRYAHGLVASGLIDEYREDLVNAMVSEGIDQDEAEQTVQAATTEQIAGAHQRRRIAGDPNVRRIDEGMIEKAYGRAAKSLGIKIENMTSPKDLATTRETRKANLTPQPRRASVPKSDDKNAANPPSRSQVVAEMAAARGQKGSPART